MGWADCVNARCKPEDAACAPWLCCDRGFPAKTELRARIGVRAERRSATIILMSTASQIASEFATVSAMPRIVMPQPAKPAPTVVDAAWAESAWKQLTARDPQARFFYGVATTGVFCRPSCSSRLPLRSNVRFFRTAAEAEAAGFRACKRCRPTTASSSLLGTACSSPLDEVRAHIEKNVDRRVGLEELGRVASLSPFTVQRLFKREMGVSPLAISTRITCIATARRAQAGRHRDRCHLQRGLQLQQPRL